MRTLKYYTPPKDAQPEREAAFFTLISSRGYFADNPKGGVFLC
jgi:hypothetical protein